MSAQPLVDPPPPLPPTVAPLELARLRGSVRAGLFGAPTQPPRVGRYELLRCIGQGGMGIVYAARDVELDREVAIKLLRPELSAHDDGRLASEARALARLSHPNVVGIFDVGVYEGQQFIAMEYVVGQELRRWLDAPRRLRELLQMFVAAGHGLSAAHEVGLVHRDFKPDNVLVGDDGRPRVLDFGLARPPDGPSPSAPQPPSIPASVDPLATMLTAVGQVLGTPAYMAPEQHLGEPSDARSDQFSFAVSLYHAVYGVRPFSGRDPSALALSIVRGRVRPASPRYPVPAWLDALLGRALAVDPDQRFESMRAMLAVMEHELASGAGGAELEVLPSRAIVDELERRESSEAWGPLDSWDPAGPRGSALAEVSAGAAPRPSLSAVALPRPPEDDVDGVTMSMSTRRTIAGAISEESVQMIVQELERMEGGRGRVSRLGSSMVWSRRGLEVHVDVMPSGAELLVWRKLDSKLYRRILGHIVGGLWIAGIIIGAVEGGSLISRIELFNLVPLFVLGTLTGGVAAGFLLAKRRHQQSLPSERAQVEFIADRLVSLARTGGSALSPEGYTR